MNFSDKFIASKRFVLFFFILSFHFLKAQDSLYFFQAKSEIEIEKSGVKESFTAHIRYNLRDTLWMSFTGTLGIEGARMLVTSDSTYIINKLENSGYCMKTGEENNFIPFGLNIDDWQMLLLQTGFKIDSNTDVRKEVTNQRSYINRGPHSIKSCLEKGSYITNYDIVNTKSSAQCRMSFSDFDINTNLKSSFSKIKNIKITSPDMDNVQILIKYVDYKFNNPQPFVFNFAKYRNGAQ